MQPGAYLSGVSGATLTLASGYTISANHQSGSFVAMYQLPAALKFTVQTTIGSNSAIVTAGPRPLASGEMIWSDAFPLGSMVENTSGNTFPQTVQITGPFNNVLVQNATVTHSSGAPGQMWVVPAGLKRDVQSNSNYNLILYWPMGLGDVLHVGRVPAPYR